MKKKLFKSILIISLIPILLFSGCLKKKDKSTEKLVLGLDASFPPMGFKDENNNIVGFDIDLAKEVCKRLNMELVTQPIIWDNKEYELNAGNIDCVWNGMSYSDDRAAAMLLSKPYMNNDMVMVVRNDSGINSLADLKGKKVSVQNGSTAQEILNSADFIKTLKEVVPLADNSQAFVELDMKTVDAVFLDKVVADYYVTTKNKNFKVLSDGIAPEKYVIGFKKGNEELKNKIEETLLEMKKDGKLAEISTKWFGKDVTIIE